MRVRIIIVCKVNFFLLLFKNTLDIYSLTQGTCLTEYKLIKNKLKFIEMINF